ncbi:UNVERIFIED_CONTAM: Sulfate transporter 2.1 [Sesamum radiatum]|uniref:Sulfate transporter 2.1 n=1 Tax=Sesamum radiatum TaxID=300843 RepID=A0AAW2SJP4_SESRA
MSNMPADNSMTELQQLDADTATATATGRSERAKWLLTSPDPPAPWHQLFSSIKQTLLPQPKPKQPRPNRPFLFMQTLFPILKWGKNYKAAMFKNDLLAGLTLASLCIPQSIGYANLAKMDPQYGLYTSVVPPLIYAVMGSSRDIAIGPVAVVSLLLSAMISKVVDPSVDPVTYRRTVFTVTFFTGAFQTLFGVFRLGFLVDFLSHAAIVGFMGGAAIWYPLNAVLGCSFLIFILITRFIEAIAVGRSFASMKGYHLEGNKEMVAMGFMNIIGSLTSCYTATGSFSRTAVNYSAGCETVVSNIVMSITVLICLLFFTKLLYYTPLAILASIILSALPGLIDLHAAYNIWKVDKLDFMVCLGAFLGVLFGSVEIGLLVATRNVIKNCRNYKKYKNVGNGGVPL